MELDWLKRWNLYAPEKIAVKDGDTGDSLTYHQLFQSSLAKAQDLRTKYKIKKNDRIAVLAMNELEYVVLFFAALRVGAVLVPINFRLTYREVEHIVSNCEPSLLVYQEAFQELVNQLKHEGKVFQTKLLSEKANEFKSLNESFEGEPEDPVMILYTSGTTGAPKGAILTHEMIFWNSINTTLRLNLSQQDCTVIFLPFFHTGGWNVLTTPLLHRGGTLVLLKKFDGNRILQLTESENGTILFGVPTTMDMMAHSPLFDKVNLSKVRYAIVGGEPMPIDLIKAWDKKGIPIRQGYGLTEFGPNVFSLNEEDAIRKIGSIGFPNFYIDAKVVDNHGHEVAANEIGELILKGPMCMQGYWKNPKATAETIKDGWLYTGDLVRCDTDGYFYVVGRKKDMFISGGENVYPPELEQVIRALPGVREVAVVGVPDDRWGEVGKAFVVRDKVEISESDLLTHCLKNLAKFKIPKYFVFLPELPKGDSGKILKRKLLEQAPL
ncbi:MAG: long-chain fatty acid--CoA ligase [Bdellovibrionaceae bacterium]|nr:long-chain fatty acid--CoA ligase [Pseudobdellovibrionaceae bacterium]